jgi:hypothetical protein
MAGQTKLIGFGLDGQSVHLERWGKKATVDVGSEAVARLKAACHRVLPIVPHTRGSGHLPDFHVTSDYEMGRVMISVSKEEAHLLNTLFRQADKEGYAVAIETALGFLSEYEDLDEPGVEL